MCAERKEVTRQSFSRASGEFAGKKDVCPNPEGEQAESEGPEVKRPNSHSAWKEGKNQN